MSAHLRFELPLALVINANRKKHWAPEAQQKRDLRALGRLKARDLPPIKSDRAILHIDIGWPTRRQADAENLAGTIKALTDGIVGDGALLSNDSDAHIVERRWRGHYEGRAGITVIDMRFEEVAPND